MKRYDRIGWAVLASLALVTAGSGTASAADTLREQSDLVLDTRGWKALEVENSRGPVELKPSTDGQMHLVAVKIVHGRDRAQSTSLAREI